MISKAALQGFQWADYIISGTMLVVCIALGLYFGISRASRNTEGYLLGGRNMGLTPTTLSLIASAISAVTILGIPADAYLYGIHYVYILIGVFIMSVVKHCIILPVFYDMKIITAYEYLERRFDKKVRLFSSMLFILDMAVWLPNIVYAAALACNQVTGVSLHVLIPTICITCIFYTALGGLRGVIWTDVIQAGIMFGAMVLIAIKGTIDVGGFGIVWQRNLETRRIEGPSLDWHPSTKYTLWSLAIGGSFLEIAMMALSPVMLQRYLSLPSMTSVGKAIWLTALGYSLIVATYTYCGLLIFAAYHKCDPLTTGLVKKNDQMLPLFATETLGDYPGLSGIFIAGILSASLSSLSSGLNTIAGVLGEDVYHVLFNKSLTEKKYAIVMKLTVVMCGIISIGLAYSIQHLGATTLQIIFKIPPVVKGPLLGVFIMGMLLPWVNSKGALGGGATSFILMAWLCFKAHTTNLLDPKKPTSNEECSYNFTLENSIQIDTHFNMSVDHAVVSKETFTLYNISYLWYSLVAASIAVTVGLFISFITRPLHPRDVNPAYLAPCIRRFIDYPKQCMDEFDPKDEAQC